MTIRAVLVAAAATNTVIFSTVYGAPTAKSEPAESTCFRPTSNGSCVFKNCADAHNRGRYNIPSTDPAYCAKQDRDNDGIACEG